MSRYESHFLTFRRWTFILGGLLPVVFGGFYFFNVSAKTETVAKQPSEPNLVNGRLAFSSRSFPSSEGGILTANPDGSGQTGVAVQGTLIPTEPAWSPDGTKLLFVDTTQNIDIFVINANGGGQINLTNTASPIREGNPSWSVTGKIAYERDGQIWTMNEDGSGQAQFAAITRPSPSDPAWSPDGMKLAFTSGGKIWVINANGTNENQITMSATSDSDPAWSPDGSKIAFTRSNGIAVINADGTNEMTIAASGNAPSWSPDGTKIAFSVSGASGGGIFTMDPDGDNQVKIVSNFTNFPQCCDVIRVNPAWQPVAQTPNTHIISGRVTYNNSPLIGAIVNLSGTINAAVTTDAVGNYQFSGLPPGGSYTVSPSVVRHYFAPANRAFNNLTSNQTADFDVLGVCAGGRCVKNGRIAFVRGGEIYVINPDGTSQINITNNAATDGDPNYSPYGTNIIFTTNRDGNNEIYRMEEEGINLVRLTNNSASDSLPYYSPDASSIVFVSNRDGNNEIYKMNADGSDQVRLTNNMSSETQPAFSHDGQKIVFVSNASGQSNLWTMNADGSNQQAIPGTSGISPVYERPSYSPDGSKIIYTYTPDGGSQVRITWTMNPDGTNRVQSAGSFGSYSPDGTQLTYTCCIINNTNRVFTVNAGGGSATNLTPSHVGNTLPDWQGFRVPRALFDFDGDGRSDISVFRPSNGAWYLLRSTEGLWVPVWGLSTDKLAPADYDGDLKTDVAVWRPSDGNFYILNSFNSTVRVENFGLDGDIPTGGDFDGDGKADPAVYRGGEQGVFYYRGSMGNPNGNITFLPWGVSGDKSVVGDFDGDGRTDAAIYRPSNGTWYIRQSSNGQLLGVNFGLADDKLVPADYDADGKTDIAVYRGGVWYLLRSAQGFAAFQFGISTDTPAPADYDGDGKADAAIYRDGVWWILKTQSGAVEAISFGSKGDAPVPSAFVR